MEEKIYFNPGDIVSLKQDIPNKPTMLVVKKEVFVFKNQKETQDNGLKGIRCRWFASDGSLQEAVFNTKDLIKL